jgi:hypothetical protein
MTHTEIRVLIFHLEPRFSGDLKSVFMRKADLDHISHRKSAAV